MIRLVKADALHIGYPKAASTFLRNYLRQHPSCTVDHNCAANVLLSPAEYIGVGDKPDPKRFHITSDESIAESVICDASNTWYELCKVPGAWSIVANHITWSPDQTAAIFQAIYSRKTKIIIVTREQADWMNSAYQYSMSTLPPSKRSFADFLETPQAKVLLMAGHHDKVISAWRKRFSNVLVLRYETLRDHVAKFTEELCDFLEVPFHPPSDFRINESDTHIAKVQRAFPFLDRLPKSFKRALKARIKPLLPRGGMILTNDEINWVRAQYR